MTATFQILNLADRLEAVEPLAGWHWAEWGHLDPAGSRAEWVAALRRRTGRGRIPFTLVAVQGDEVLGSCSVVVNDLAAHPEYEPWLAGVFVAPAHRGAGVGRALVERATAEAAALGITTLYLHTETARPFYERLGWTVVLAEEYAGLPTVIMTITPGVLR